MFVLSVCANLENRKNHLVIVLAIMQPTCTQTSRALTIESIQLYSLCFKLARRTNVQRKQHQTILNNLLFAKNKNHLYRLCIIFLLLDIANALIESSRFKAPISSINPSLNVSTVKTLSSRLWDRFYNYPKSIRKSVAVSEFYTLAFDG